MTEAIGEVAAALRARDGRHLVVDDGIAKDHAVLAVLVVAHEGRQPFHEPRRRIGGDRLPELSLEEDLVFEDVGQLVLDELQQFLVGGVDGQNHAVARRLGECPDAFGDEVEIDVGLFERRVRGVVDERDFLGDLEVQFAGERVVGAFGVVHDLLQRVLLIVVEVHVEMRGVIDVPMELVVDDLVLPEGKCRGGGEGDCEQREETLQEASRRVAGSEWRVGSNRQSPTRHPPPATRYSVNTYRVADVSCGTKMPTSWVSSERRFSNSPRISS